MSKSSASARLERRALALQRAQADGGGRPDRDGLDDARELGLEMREVLASRLALENDPDPTVATRVREVGPEHDSGRSQNWQEAALDLAYALGREPYGIRHEMSVDEVLPAIDDLHLGCSMCWASAYHLAWAPGMLRPPAEQCECGRPALASVQASAQGVARTADAAL